MIFSDSGCSTLKTLETLRLQAYDDATGLPVPVGGVCKGTLSIGYGSTSNVVPGMIITEQEALARLQTKIAFITNELNSVIKVVLTQNQFDAVVIFTYNIGFGQNKPQHESGFDGSTMLKLLNNNSYLAAADEFPKWNHVGGVVNAGLTNRRAVERKLFLTL